MLDALSPETRIRESQLELSLDCIVMQQHYSHCDILLDCFSQRLHLTQNKLVLCRRDILFKDYSSIVTNVDQHYYCRPA